MKIKRYIVLMIVLVSIGSIYFVGNESNAMDFCVLGLSCDNDTIYLIEVYKFKDYNFTEEGIVPTSLSIEESNDYLFKTLEEVIKVSRRDYQEVIEVVSTGGDFNNIYHLNSRIFDNNYSTEIDKSSPTGEYIQNIGEIVLNGYAGDCDDYALMLYLIAKEKGLDTRYVTGRNGVYGHAWIQIKIDGEWVEYDSTSDRICDDCVSADYTVINYFKE